MAGVKFAPLNTPLNRRLQTAVVWYYCSQFLFLGFLSTLLVGYLLTTQYYYISLIYFIWMAYDREKPRRGGRRLNWYRRLPCWRWMAEFFPIKLVKTAELDPEKNYIFGLHPHGLLCFSHFVNFATEATGFSKLFPRIVPHLITLDYQFQMPFHRELPLVTGTCSSSRESINYILSQKGKGNVAAIVVGGALEVLDTIPNKMSLTLNKRKGFIRLALKNGASLVPVLSFGENELYQTLHEEGSRFNLIQEKIIKVLGIPLPVFFGRGIFQYSFGILPVRRPVTSVVGKPIDVEKVEEPTQEQIDQLHKRYCDALTELFETHKDQYGASEIPFKIK